MLSSQIEKKIKLKFKFKIFYTLDYYFYIPKNVNSKSSVLHDQWHC